MRQYVSLRGRREFALTMRRGAIVSTPALTLYAFFPRTSRPSPPKVGVVVTRKVGKAVLRNQVRRRCKAILETILEPTDARWYVIACRPVAATTPFAELRRQLSGAIPNAQRARKR